MNSTIHADYRARKRMGVADISKSFAEAMKSGLHQRDTKGQLRKYLDKSAQVHKSTPTIYRGMVYWHREDTLITVIPLHQKWHKYIKES